MEWGTEEREGGAQWKEAPVIFLWRDPHLLRCCAKDGLFRLTQPALADGLSRNFVGESASWPNGTSGKSISQQPPNFHGTQQNIAWAAAISSIPRLLARDSLRAAAQKPMDAPLQWLDTTLPAILRMIAKQLSWDCSLLVTTVRHQAPP
jgi:hypothetical protein